MNIAIKVALKESGKWMTTEEIHQVIGDNVERQALSRRLATIAAKGQIIKKCGDKSKGIPHQFHYNPDTPARNVHNMAERIKKVSGTLPPEDDRSDLNAKVGCRKHKNLGQYPLETYLICCARWNS